MSAAAGTGGGPIATPPVSPVPADLAELSGQTPLAGVWEGGIRLNVPGFSGSPADYVSVVLDDRSLRFFDFEHFSQWVRFDAGDPLGAVPLGNSFSGGELLSQGTHR